MQKLVAPHAVLSPGPRLAGTPSKGRKLTSKFTTFFGVGKLTVWFFYGRLEVLLPLRFNDVRPVPRGWIADALLEVVDRSCVA